MRQRTTSQSSTSSGGGARSLAAQAAAIYARLGTTPKALYEFGNPAARFQDIYGTAAATAAGNSLALLLDQSYGAVRGPELWSNPAIDPPWVANGDGSYSKPSAGSVNSNLRVTGLTVGKYYEVTFNLLEVSGPVGMRVLIGSSNLSVQFLTPGIKTYKGFCIGNNVMYVNGGPDSGGTVRDISFRELPGNHVGQVTATSRALLQFDGAYPYAQFDGADDSWYSLANLDLSSTDKVTVIAGVRKRSDANVSMLAELGPTFANVGTFGIQAPNSPTFPNFIAAVNGSTIASKTASGYPAPASVIFTAAFNTSGATLNDQVALRINGAVPASSGSGLAGGGSFTSAVLNIGRRNNSAQPAAIDLFTLQIIGAALSAADLQLLERYAASKMPGNLIP